MSTEISIHVVRYTPIKQNNHKCTINVIVNTRGIVLFVKSFFVSPSFSDTPYFCWCVSHRCIATFKEKGEMRNITHLPLNALM